MRPGTHLIMEHESDPAKTLMEQLGDLSGIVLARPEILVATYVRPEKTKGGIFVTDKTRDEDKWQGKVGLVVKLGPGAFVDDDKNKFEGFSPKIGEWVFYRPSDGLDMQINGVRCRLLLDAAIRGVTDNPDTIW